MSVHTPPLSRRAALAVGAGTVLASAATFGAKTERAQDSAGQFPNWSWAKRNPEEAGVSSQKLTEFARLVGGKGCIAPENALLHTWGEYDRPSDVASALKPFYSYLLLKALEVGQLKSLDQPVMDLACAT
jgi:hypothetical protein